MDRIRRLAMLLGTPVFLLSLASCAELAGIALPGEQHDTPKPDDLPKTQGGEITPGASDQPGSDKVDAGGGTNLPPGTTCGTCKSDPFTTSMSIDTVALTPTTVLVGDAKGGEVFECRRNDPNDCWTVADDPAVGESVGYASNVATFFDHQTRNIYGCADGVDCTRRAGTVLGQVDDTDGIPPLTGSGQRAFWSRSSGLVGSRVDGSGSEINPTVGNATRVAALTNGSTTVVGATLNGAWALLIPANKSLTLGEKHVLTTTMANDVSVDAQFIWIAQNDGLFRTTLDGAAATLFRPGKFIAVASANGVAYAIADNGDLFRVQDGQPDTKLAEKALRAWADTNDGFVYFKTGIELRRAAR